MPTSTTNYGLIKPGTDDPILIGQINDNMDTVDTVLKDHSDKIDAAALGIKFKGEVNYYSNLPNGAEIGDAYTVKYAGSSGTTPDGTEYVWGAVSGVNQWINFSKDSYSKAEVDALLALKQNALTTSQLAAANSGINSEKVEQIETNKNNILSLQNSRGILSDATTIIDTDWTLTTIELIAPVNSIVNMTATLVYGAKAPRGIRITRSNTSPTTGVIANIEVSDDKPQIITQAIGVKLNSINTYYVWAKAKAATTNVPAYLIYEIY